MARRIISKYKNDISFSKRAQKFKIPRETLEKLWQTFINKVKNIQSLSKNNPKQLRSVESSSLWKEQLPEVRQPIEVLWKPKTQITEPSVLPSELKYFPFPDTVPGSSELAAAKERFARIVLRKLLESYHRNYLPSSGPLTKEESRLLVATMSPDEVAAAIRWLNPIPPRMYRGNIILLDRNNPDEYQEFITRIKLLEGYLEGRIPGSAIKTLFGALPSRDTPFFLSITPETQGLLRRHPGILIPNPPEMETFGGGIKYLPQPTFFDEFGSQEPSTPIRLIAPRRAENPRTIFQQTESNSQWKRYLPWFLAGIASGASSSALVDTMNQFAEQLVGQYPFTSSAINSLKDKKEELYDQTK